MAESKLPSVHPARPTPVDIKAHRVRDYRAGAAINFEMDAADKDKQITTPLLRPLGDKRDCADRRISDGTANYKAGKSCSNDHDDASRCDKTLVDRRD